MTYPDDALCSGSTEWDLIPQVSKPGERGWDYLADAERKRKNADIAVRASLRCVQCGLIPECRADADRYETVSGYSVADCITAGETPAERQRRRRTVRKLAILNARFTREEGLETGYLGKGSQPSALPPSMERVYGLPDVGPEEMRGL